MAKNNQNTCWVDEKNKIISFHSIDNFIRHTFDTHKEYLEYIIRRSYCGYKVT